MPDVGCAQDFGNQCIGSAVEMQRETLMAKGASACDVLCNTTDPEELNRLCACAVAEEKHEKNTGQSGHFRKLYSDPDFPGKFQDDLTTPGLRIPITADADTFAAVAAVGRRVIAMLGCTSTRTSVRRTPPVHYARSRSNRDESSDRTGRCLHLGGGYIDHVSRAVWAYEVDRKQVIPQWFSYRKRDRSKPPMGDKRPPSPLQAIQPNHWLAEYTTDLLDLLNVLTLLVDLEPKQAELLDSVCGGPLISEAELLAEGALRASPAVDTYESNEEVQQGLF